MRRFLCVPLVSSFALACINSGGSTRHVAEESDTDTDADTDTDTDTGEDTGEDTGVDDDSLLVAALGFEYVGGWDEEGQLLENFVYEDNSGDLAASGYFVRVTLASLKYFEMSSDTPGFEDEYCEFIASFHHAPAELVGVGFDWDAGKGSTGEELETWGSFEGYLEISTNSYSYRCEELNEDQFEGGDPVATLDLMHFGLGFGPLSAYLVDALKDGASYAEYKNSYMAQYIAINHPDGAGGVTFEAFDWNGSILVKTDYESCVEVDDGAGGTFEVCGQPEVTEDSTYVPGDATMGPRHGFNVGFSSWLEDTPNLDLSLFLEGNGL